MTARTRKLTVTTIVGFLALALVGSATAYFSTLGSGSGSAATGTLNAPTNLLFDQEIESSIDIGWTVPAGSVPVEEYKVFRADEVLPVCTVEPPAHTCTDSTDVEPSQIYTYTVTAYAGSWSATSAPVQHESMAAAAAPEVDITFPGAGPYTTSGQWTVGCTPAGFCGTAEADGAHTLEAVEYSLQLGANYWNGTAFAATSPEWIDVQGLETWNVPFAFPASGTYILSVRATDDRDVVGLDTVTFTIGAPTPTDTTPPQLQTLTMLDDDKDGKVDMITAVFNEALQASTDAALWTLSGSVPSNGTKGTVSTSGSTATLLITEGSSAADTSVPATFKIALAAGAAGIRDAAGNQASFAATSPSDGAAPVLLSVASSNRSGGTAGKAETSDTVSFTFSEALAAGSVPTSGSLTLTDPPGNENDTIAVAGVITTSNLGTANYIGGNNKVATFTTTIALTNSSRTILITLGTCSGDCTNDLNGGSGTSAFSPVVAATLKDGANNTVVPSTIAPVIRLF